MASACRLISSAELKLREPIELTLDDRFMVGLIAFAHPMPGLNEKAFLFPVGFQIKTGDNLVADQNRQGEIAKLALLLRYIDLKDMVIIEEGACALSLNDQRVERRQDMRQRRLRRRSVQRFRPPPMLHVTAFNQNRP